VSRLGDVPSRLATECHDKAPIAAEGWVKDAHPAVLAANAQKGHPRSEPAGPLRGATMEISDVNMSTVVKPVAVAATAFGILMLPGLLAAQAPTKPDSARTSASGNYLAARHAVQQRDAASAAAYFRAALRSDPKNPDLLQRAFGSALTEGDMEESFRLAERILQINKTDRDAKLVLGVRALKNKQWPAARQNITQSVKGPVTDLTAALLIAWTQYGAGDSKAAIETIDRLQGPDWYNIFKDSHAGMLLDIANRKKEAAKRFEKVHKLDGTNLRVVESYGSFLSRHGTKDEALDVFRGFDKALPRHPLVTTSMKEVEDGQKLPPLVQSAQAGAAEVLYGIGAVVGRRGGEDLGVAYLQLALYLEPKHPLALLSLADLYETMKKPELAIKVYRRIPADSPLHRNAEIQLAANLDSLEKTEEAKDHLRKLIEENPADMEATMMLGHIERSRKQYADCAVTYSKVIDQLKEPTRANWNVFYSRGICNERNKNWPGAEADFKKSLELFPDRADVLNYLGYSWVDQGVNLDEGMKMIRRAVEQKPDDGYIVDSLGWAYYRIGNYEEAVKHLERAVEIRPEDPTINDHLGDAYWKVGRQLEAHFQWSHAAALKPEADELLKIQTKMKDGMPDDGPGATAEQKKSDNGG
jgi:tetratricopeptide (TPR) repeat protein